MRVRLTLAIAILAAWFATNAQVESCPWRRSYRPYTPAKPAAAPAKPAAAPAKPSTTPAPKKADAGTSGKLVVSLPADARLFLNDQPTQQSSATRSFVTPKLQLDKEYYYVVKAVVVRDGQSVTTTKEVAIKAGQEARVQLDFPKPSVAAK